MLLNLRGRADSKHSTAHFSWAAVSNLLKNSSGQELDYDSFKAEYDTNPQLKNIVKSFDGRGLVLATKAKDVQPNAQKIKSSEDKLSSKAQKYLETLRKDNADFDFIIADKGDDFRGLVDQSDKEFTVVFSSAELERMASDEKYAREKLSTVKTAVEMSDKINEQFGFERAWGTTDNSGTVLNKLTMSFDDDGKMTLFADLEKITEKQKERLEELKEKRAEEKKQEKKDVTVKRTTIQANSKEELLEKISELDWSKITEEKATQGMKFDITI